jgi:hypothetical protein
MRQLLLTGLALVLSTAPAAADDCRVQDRVFGAHAATVDLVLGLAADRRVNWDAVLVTAANRPDYARMQQATEALTPLLAARVAAVAALQAPMAACLAGTTVEYGGAEVALFEEARAAGEALLPAAIAYIAAYEALPD